MGQHALSTTPINFNLAFCLDEKGYSSTLDEFGVFDWEYFKAGLVHDQPQLPT
jgi:hypothetical protein